MSRIRIVGGKITEIVGGDYNIYSASDIVFNSGKSVITNGKQGVVIGNKVKKPTLYVKDLKADKPEAQPNEKVTFTVTQYSKEEWAGKEIIVMPYLVKATEKVSEKVKIKIEKFPMLIVQGKKRVGKNADGSLANDLYFGDYTDWKKEKIKEKLITDLQRQNAYSDKNKGKIDKILNLIWNYKDYDKETLSKKFLGSFSINFPSKKREYFVKFLYDIKGSYHSITASNGETYDVKKITGKLLEDALQADELQEFVKTTKTHIKKHIKMNENKLYVLEIKSDETGNI